MTTTPTRRAPRRGEDIIQQETSGKERRVGPREWWIPKGSTFINRMREALGVGSIDLKRKAPFDGQPWVTPIIGSGPLGLPAAFVEQTEHLPTAVVLSVRAAWPKHAADLASFAAVGADIDCWLADFAYTMISQRVRGSERNRRPEPGERTPEAIALADDLDPAAALLVLVAAQLTRTFHRMSLDTCRPISRWGSEQASMTSQHDRRLDLDDEYVRLLTQACKAASSLLKVRADEDTFLAPTLNSIQELLTSIQEGVTADPAKVALVHLEQATEAAWLMVVDSLAGSAYPGWTNLLLRLVLSDDNNTDFVRPRWLDMRTLGDAVRDIVEPMSQASWEFGNTRERAANRDFYDSVAQGLWAQNEVREVIRARNDDPQAALPARPVAYVSSFDFELEMALWRTAAEYEHAGTFSVVFPAYAVSDSDAHLGTFVWLEAVVATAPSLDDSTGQRDPADLERMREVTTFRLLDSKTPADSFNNHPIVVCIVGCPLLNLPERISETFSRDLFETSQLADVTGFVHAVTVDEYLALRQTERDWALGLTESHHGLPSAYFDSGQSSPRRFWMVLGVPFRDPAIRLRVMSVLARSEGRARKRSETPKKASGAAKGEAQFVSLMAGGPPAKKKAESAPVTEEPRYGVAVNTRTDDEEIMLLNSLGFPVVRGTSESFTEDLRGYAAELASAAVAFAKKPADKEDKK